MMTKKKHTDEFSCRFLIDTLTDHPNVITELTGLPSSEMIVKGSAWLSPMTKKVIEGKFNEVNLWIYETPKIFGENGVYLNNAVWDIMNILDTKRDIFRTILLKYPQNHIVCNGYFYDANSYFKFDKELLGRLAFYNIDIEFDVYFLNE